MNSEYREFFTYLRGLLQSGAITYEQAKEQAQPKLDEMNAKGREIAKRFNKTFKPFTFTGVMR